MKSYNIQLEFLKFFKAHGHTHYPSSSLIPKGDPTLLFTNAGMNQFKDVFLGAKTLEHNKVVTVQKCLRAGGKHNDLENVGYTQRHHTFFEMLGNFSFGDYFKEKAISLSWDFVTSLGLDKNRIFISVYEKDEQSAQLWLKLGIKKDHIFYFGEEDNFWKMGQVGPCGPCTEMYYQILDSPKVLEKHQVEKYCVEFWNLVFMQFEEKKSGEIKDLKNTCVDTGMGLERMTMILQGKKSNYETNIFLPLLETIQKKSQRDLKESLQTEISMKVLADHSRAIAFLMGDGVLASSDGAGYVLRRIIRRALRYGKKISNNSHLLSNLVERVIDLNQERYLELKQQKEVILSHIKREEKQFLKTLDTGLEILTQYIEKLPQTGSRVLKGQHAFKLYDTYGFPFDLTKLICKEKECLVDEHDFKQKLLQAKKTSLQAKQTSKYSFDEKKNKILNHIQNKKITSVFTGYENIKEKAHVKLIMNENYDSVDTVSSENEKAYIIFDKSPFYGESGGQIGDSGFIKDEKGTCVALVTDCQKANLVHVHSVEVLKGEKIKKSSSYLLEVNKEKREQIAIHHSATHLLHWALRKTLGHHVRQSGSLVDSEKLRFDFSHHKPLTQQEIHQVESLITDHIQKKYSTTIEEQDYKEALKKGALAWFNEKYDKKVRVLTLGDSKELCGGIHVKNTADICVFKIISEKSIQSGTRRIVALAGFSALKKLGSTILEYYTLYKIYSHNETKEFFETFKKDNDTLIFNIQKLINKQQHLKDLVEDLNQSKKYLKLNLDQDSNFNIQIKDNEMTAFLKKPTVLMEEVEKRYTTLKKHKMELFKKPFYLKEFLQLSDQNIKKIQKKSQQKETKNWVTESVLKKVEKIQRKNYNFSFLFHSFPVNNIGTLREISDSLTTHLPDSICILTGDREENCPILIRSSKKLHSLLKADDILKFILKKTQGKGGGRADLAQGIIKNTPFLKETIGKWKSL